MKIKSILMTGSLTLMLAAQSVFALSSYQSRVPNGTVLSCNTCHDPLTGPPNLNPFGNDFANNGHAWSATLAALDSDGDGFKNGVELGDPAGTWVAGSANPAGPAYNPGDATSHPAPVATAPSITTQPVSQTVTAGANVTFTVAATGTAPLSYQWKKGGVNVTGATAASLTLSSVATTDAGSYTVLVSNSAGSVTSSAATLTVNPAIVAPAITTQPVSQTVTAGANVTFTVAATGTAPLSYQWKKGGVNVTGATAASLTLSSVATTDAGSYTVLVSNSAGSVTSSAATLTVNPAIVAPAITTQPVSQTVTAGANVTFTVAATGTAPLSYQWKKGGVNVTGATAASLTLSSVATTDAGSYTVLVSNSAGSVTSSAATLTVNPAVVAPAITLQPLSQTVTAGANVTFSVAATGTAPLSYQWKKNGANITGATGPSLALTSVGSADVGTYTVVVSNTAGSATSNPATLTVNVARPTLTIALINPTNGATFVAPVDVALEAAPSPTNNIAMVEFFDGTNLLGSAATAPYSLTVSNMSVGSHGLTAKVTAMDLTTATSDVATISVVETPPSSTNQPPTVQLAYPRDYATFWAPARVMLVAQAADADGTIAKVEFFSGSTLLGTGVAHTRSGDDEGSSSSGTTLYYFVWDNVPAGQYSVTAKATDNRGATTTSAVKHVIVKRFSYTPPPHDD